MQISTLICKLMFHVCWYAVYGSSQSFFSPMKAAAKGGRGLRNVSERRVAAVKVLVLTGVCELH